MSKWYVKLWWGRYAKAILEYRGHHNFIYEGYWVSGEEEKTHLPTDGRVRVCRIKNRSQSLKWGITTCTTISMEKTELLKELAMPWTYSWVIEKGYT